LLLCKPTGRRTTAIHPGRHSLDLLLHAANLLAHATDFLTHAADLLLGVGHVPLGLSAQSFDAANVTVELGLHGLGVEPPRPGAAQWLQQVPHILVEHRS